MPFEEFETYGQETNSGPEPLRCSEREANAILTKLFRRLNGGGNVAARGECRRERELHIWLHYMLRRGIAVRDNHAERGCPPQFEMAPHDFLGVGRSEVNLDDSTATTIIIS